MTSIDIKSLDYASVVSRQASTNGSRTFMLFEERRFTFLDTHLLSNRVGNGLIAAGVRPGNHVAIMLDNCPEIAWYYFAIGKIGAVCVPLNTAAKGELLARYLRRSNATSIVISANLLPRLHEVAAECPGLRRCVVLSASEAELRTPRSAALEYVSHLDVADAADADPGVPVRFSDLAYLSFTSGTSGPSKANMSTHSHAFTMAASLADAFEYGAEEVMYTCLPLFHGNAMRSLFIPMVTGCSVAVSKRFSPKSYWSDVRRFGATQFNLLGAMANMLWSQPKCAADKEHGATKCMIIPVPSFGREFADRFGVNLCSAYALTDFGYISFLRADAPRSKWNSAGKPQPDVELAILDEDDFEVSHGQVGEICARNLRPWTSAQGYYGMPDATLSAWRNLWFHTGDRGCVDQDGYLYFVDRKKDAIRRRGENISSYEVEQVILQHPSVLDVAAFAVTSELSEDEVMVSVVLRPGAALDEEELVRHCERNMAYFMVPRYIQFLTELPRTLTEKVEKYKLRQAAESELAMVWDREKSGIVLAR